MTKNLRWKTLIIIAVLVLAVVSFWPPFDTPQRSGKIRLGLDLKGGVHLVLRVQTDDALRLDAEMASERLRETVGQKGISGVTVTAQPPTRIQVTGVPTAQDQAFRQIGDTELATQFTRTSGPAGSYTFELKPNVVVQLREQAVEQALQTIERRVNELGVAEPIVAPHGSSGDQILVQLPGVTDVNRAKEIIRATAMLELKIVEAGPASSQETLLQPHGGTVPPDMEVIHGRRSEQSGLDRLLPGQEGGARHGARFAERALDARREQPAGGRLHDEP